jgi:(E)-4-hydroxy-3-methylbut-2-enyl-diphosphate synthase
MKNISTRQIRIGNIRIGGGADVTLQSMTNTPTENPQQTLKQICELADNGCDIIRIAIPNKEAVLSLPEILDNSPIPVIGDIHFDHRLALDSIKAGIDAIRINPGNIGSPDKVREVAQAAGDAGIPIRVGSNTGSLPQDIIEEVDNLGLDKENAKSEALIRSALRQCEILEGLGFRDIKVSLKSPDVKVMIRANREFSDKYNYPLHLGVTEAGTMLRGTIKSSVGIGTLLQEGIGDTIRISLTADPIEEIKAGKILLETLGLKKANPEIISCPTCGRTEIDLISLTEKVERKIEELKSEGVKLRASKVAVMGCVVNGPGEAKDADLGIAGSKGGKASVFKKGKSLGMFPEEEAFELLIRELKRI